MSDSVQPAIPVELETLKASLREGISPASRQFWWPILPGIGLQTTRIDVDPDISGCAERLAGVLKEPLLDHKASEALYKSQSEAEALDANFRNLGYVLVNTRKIDQAGLVYLAPFLRLLLHVLKRIDICCWVASAVLADRRFGQFDFAGSYATINTFKDLLKAFSPKTFGALTSLGALDDKYLSVMFTNFFSELLPPNMVYTIVDAYLLEGSKILYRYALALVASYKGSIKEGKFPTAKDFWLTIKADSVAHANNTNQVMLYRVLGLEEALPVADAFVLSEACLNDTLLSQLQDLAFDRSRPAMQRLSRPMPIASKQIAALFQKHVSEAPPPPQMPSAFVRKASLSTSPLRTSISEKFLHSEQSNSTSQAGGSAGLGRKNSMRTASRQSITGSPMLDDRPSSSAPSPSPSQAETFTSLAGPTDSPSASTTPVAVVDAFEQAFADSQLIPGALQSALRTQLPACMTISPLRLRYATYRDGWDLSTLYASTAPTNTTTASAPLQHLVLLFRLQSPARLIVAATVKGPLRPSTHVLGDGASSSLLSVLLPEEATATGSVQAYPWIGIAEAKELQGLEEAAARGEVAGEVAAALRQFCLCTHEALSIGASVEQACNAIRLQAGDMGTLFLGPSETFNNPPFGQLMGVEGEGARGFPLQDIEIFSTL